jgi:hypothetical protein
MHNRNEIFWLLIIDKRNTLATLHNIKTHTKDQYKNMRDNHAHLGMNSAGARNDAELELTNFLRVQRAS